MKKLRKNKGFTLVETLACVVTLLLISMLCTTGMKFAMNSYQRSVFESDGQMLQSTLDMYISDVLRHATSIQAEADGTVIAFTNDTYKIYNGKIAVPDKTEDAGGNFLVYNSEAGDGALVVGVDSYSQSLYIESFTLLYNSDTKVFTGSYLIKSTILDDVERECTFTCRSIAEYD